MLAHGGGSTKQFSLTVAERGVFGLKFAQDTLRFSPAGGAIFTTSVGALFSGGFLTGAVFIRKRATFLGMETPRWMSVLFAALMFAVALGHLLDQIRSGVVVSPKAVEIRKRLGTTSIPWGAIDDIQVVETTPPKMMQPRVTIGGPGPAVSLDTSSSRAFLTLTSGERVELRGFNATAKASGLSLGMPTTTEIKVGSLRRYREVFIGPWPTSASPADGAIAPNQEEIPRQR